MSGFIALMLWPFAAVAAGVVAHRKRRLVRSWVAGAILTGGWPALALVAVLPPLPEPGQDPQSLARRIAVLEAQLAGHPADPI